MRLGEEGEAGQEKGEAGFTLCQLHDSTLSHRENSRMSLGSLGHEGEDKHHGAVCHRPVQATVAQLPLSTDTGHWLWHGTQLHVGIVAAGLSASEYGYRMRRPKLPQPSYSHEERQPQQDVSEHKGRGCGR